MAFTEEQQLAIDKEGMNIIVSAGAGSGKTAVLTERVIRKLKQGVPIDHLLVLTFTNEAANETKSRIREMIIQNKLTDQLARLDSTFITTFDSYALALVKKYNYLLNVSDNLKIIDSGIITIYKKKVLTDIFENHYGEVLFDRLITDFCQKDDVAIKEFIIEVSNKFDLLVDREEYINNYFTKFYSEKHIADMLGEYLKLIKHKIIEVIKLNDELKNFVSDEIIGKLTIWLNPLTNGDNYQEYQLFLAKDKPRFSKMSDEGIKIKEALVEKTDELKKLLRFHDETEIKAALLNTQDYVKVIIDIIKELDLKVANYKDKYNVYEFNDIALMAIDIVKNNPAVRTELKAYFNEIMVDEYQDTSNIQETFLNYIANNNLYMVGDIKQSIYRFRNAKPQIFQKKYAAYTNHQDGYKIDLNKNFRSRKEVLDGINKIFNLIMDDVLGNANYLEEHNMIYGNTDYDSEDNHVDNNLAIYNYEVNKEDKFTKEEKELFIISEDIIDKISHNYQVFDKKTKKLRPLKYADICIITDRNKYLTTYKKILEYHKIPSVIYMNEQLTDSTLTLVIKNLIDLVWHIGNNIIDDKFRYVYTSIARSFICEYDDNTIYHQLKSKQYADEIIMLAKAIDLGKPLTEIITDIIDKYQVYDHLTKLPEIEKNIVIIDNLIDLSNNLSSLGYTIGDFIDYLDDTLEQNIPITYNTNTSSENAVKIMNIHKSKGLEFSICYFTGMYNKFTIGEVKSKNIISEKYGIIMPYMHGEELANTILNDLYVDNYYQEEISEKIRLFYVALTRCREKIIILAPLAKNNDKFHHFVPYDVRIKYRSFLDILNSLAIISKYTVEKQANYTREYNKISLNNITKGTNNLVIEKKYVKLEYQELNSHHFSKENFALLDEDMIKNMKLGTKIHQILEYSNFDNPDNIYVKNLRDLVPNNYLNTYHEYEFKYNLNDTQYHGIIDLMIEYDHTIYLIDYKLNSITDKEYLKQIKGYKNYLESITDKVVKTYLYSVIDNYLMEVCSE